MNSLNDDFNDLVRDEGKWKFGTLTPGLSSFDSHIVAGNHNGHLEIAPRAAIAGPHYGGYVSARRWDMTGASTVVEVIRAATGSANTIFSLVVDSNNWVRFVVEGKTLFFQSRVEGIKSSTSVPYNPSQHKFWRFRHGAAANIISWETSPDGVTWHVQHATTAEFTIDAVYIELNAGTYRPVVSPGLAAFDNFRFTQSDQ